MAKADTDSSIERALDGDFHAPFSRLVGIEGAVPAPIFAVVHDPAEDEWRGYAWRYRRCPVPEQIRPSSPTTSPEQRDPLPVADDH
ncbi:MAG TPA: hypothetical protein VKI99_22240 [Candidatus Dormibacteraeota bacterium]|nr:hypothetical protein [Candidatus Dormibacteraeota bacterium]